MDEEDFYLKDLESKLKKIDKSKYYLSYSGGKDSHFLYWFIKEYLHDDEIEIVSVNTYICLLYTSQESISSKAYFIRFLKLMIIETPN